LKNYWPSDLDDVPPNTDVESDEYIKEWVKLMDIPVTSFQVMPGCCSPPPPGRRDLPSGPEPVAISTDVAVVDEETGLTVHQEKRFGT